MKKYYLSVFFISSMLCAFSQSENAKEPFIIKGQLTGIAPGQMILFFRDPHKGYKEYVIETIDVDSAGKFYLKTYNLTQPTTVTLRKEFISINLYAAPGYDLVLEGDVSDITLFQQKKKITGKGSAPNMFLTKWDAIEWAVPKDAAPWNTLPLKDLTNYVQRYKQMRDSLTRLVFGKSQLQDKWFIAFENISQLDTKFLSTYYILSGVMWDTTLTYAQSLAFVKKNTDQQLLSNLYDDRNLVSDNYQGWLMGTYPAYLHVMANRKNHDSSGSEASNLQLISKIDEHYKNKIREIRLYIKIEQSILFCRSFEEYYLYQERLPAYIAKLKSKKDRQKLDSLLVAMESSLAATQIGLPAPDFKVKDSSGRLYGFAEFKGKVLYIDLWASWCAPCREETPFLNKLYEKYKGNENIAVISISVLDRLEKWKQALVADRPAWPQFFDTDKIVERSYAAKSIPKFILINKKGEIVSFDAPKPSSGDVIVQMIDLELSK